jgi:CHRD domain
LKAAQRSRRRAVRQRAGGIRQIIFCVDNPLRESGAAAKRIFNICQETPMNRTPHLLLRAGLLATTLAFGACSMTPMASGSGAATPMMATQTFRATLSSAAEVPANASTGTGSLEASLDKGTSVLRWKVTYTGLTGPATMAHFHGPAMPGANAGVVVPFSSAASMGEGSATLTPAQIADLMAGKWYVNVHTAQNPGGEIRGQVMAN